MNSWRVFFSNGNGNGNATAVNDNSNSNGSGIRLAENLKYLPISFFSRLFNIVPSQWPRVTECWLFTFFFKLGAAIGWTVIVAAFVSKFGIAFLPMLFVLNATLIMVSTLFFEHFIIRIKKEVLMIVMVLFAAICIFFASFLYSSHPIAFFTLIIFAESFFLAQYNIFIPILVGERFTPLESQKTFPFIESGETIGGILGGLFVGIFAARFPLPWFLYAWIMLLACIIFVFILTSYLRKGVPRVPIRAKHAIRDKPDAQLKLVFQSIKKLSFLKGLIVIVLLQWVFMNILEFQFTKAVEQQITHTQESTIAYDDSYLFQAALLRSEEGAGESDVSHEPPPPTVSRELTVTQQQRLTRTLGALKSIFHASALVMQILVASRLITWLGIVGSLLIHPIVMLMSLVGMFFKFGYTSAVVSRLNFEATYAVHKNAYLASHYAFPQRVRDQAAEFLEGFVRPLGTIVGMLFIIGFQIFFSGQNLSMFIHLIMFVIMGITLFSTIRLQQKYTNISKDQLFSDLPYPEKLNAIEILAQRGHKNAPAILVQKLNEITAQENGRESSAVRIKLLAVLGQYRDYNTLPEILQAFYDSDPDIRLEAAYALMNFRSIGEKFYSQAFSRHRMIETLKEVFMREKSAAVRGAIIRVFSLLHQPDTVDFLLDVLKNHTGEIRADCVYTLGLFRDPVTAYYIAPYLKDEDLYVRANAVIAMWQFSKYRDELQKQLESMLKSSEPATAKAAIYAAGEIRSGWQKELFELLKSKDADIALESAFALTKYGNPIGFQILLDDLLALPDEKFEHLRRFLHRLGPKAREMVETVLVHYVSEKLKTLMQDGQEKSLYDLDSEVLENLRRLYKLLDQHEELFVVENAIAKRKTDDKTTDDEQQMTACRLNSKSEILTSKQVLNYNDPNYKECSKQD